MGEFALVRFVWITLLATSVASQRQVIVGRVDGAPAGTAVSVRWFAHSELPGECLLALTDSPLRERDVATNAAGVFRLEVSGRGPFAVSVATDDGRRARAFPVMAGQFVELSPRRWPTIAGVVKDRAGLPVSGARVSTGHYSELSAALAQRRYVAAPRVVTTDQQGGFELPVPLRFGLFADRGLFATDGEQASSARFYLLPGQSGPKLELVLDRPLAVDGRFVDREGASIGGRLREVGWSRWVTAKADGTFRSGPVIRPELMFVADGYAPEFTRQAYAGRLRDVAASGLRPKIAAVPRFGVRLPEPLADRDVILLQRPGFAPAWLERTDAAGRLESSCVIPDEPLWMFVRDADRYVPQLIERGGVEADEVSVRRLRTEAVAGQALDAAGQPVVGARVQWTPLLDDKLGPGWSTYSDHAGRFRLDGVPVMRGAIVIECDEAGYRAWELSSRADRSALSLQLRKGCTVTGTVGSWRGGVVRPGARVQLIVQRHPEDAGIESRLGLIYLRTFADEKGRFAFRGLTKGDVFTVWGLWAQGGRAEMGNHTGTVTGAGKADDLTIELRDHSGRY